MNDLQFNFQFMLMKFKPSDFLNLIGMHQCLSLDSFQFLKFYFILFMFFFSQFYFCFASFYIGFVSFKAFICLRHAHHDDNNDYGVLLRINQGIENAQKLFHEIVEGNSFLESLMPCYLMLLHHCNDAYDDKNHLPGQRFFVCKF